MKRLAPWVILALLAGCGGGGASTPPTGSGPVNTGPTTLALKFTFNTKSSAVLHGRRANYVSYSTQGLGIDVVSHIGDSVLPKTLTGMRTPAFATTIAAGYSGTNTTCTALGGGGNPAGVYSCVLLVAAPSGYDDVQITTWDQTPSANGFGGTFAGSANNLSTNFLPNQLVLANQTNNFDFALDGVVASVALQVTPITLVAGAPLGQAPNPAGITLTVKAIDAQGNTIVGSDPYVDANGNAVTINVSKTESYPTPVPSPTTGPIVGPTAPPGGDLTITTSTFTSPSVTTSAVSYNGYDIASVLFNATVTENVGGANVTGPVSKATLNFTQSTNGGLNVPGQPTISEVSTGFTNTYVGGVALGPDGYDWFTMSAGSPASTGTGQIIKISPGSSPVVTPYDTTAAPCGAIGGTGAIAQGTDGAMWLTGTDGTQPLVCAINTNGTNLRGFGNFGFSGANAYFNGLALDDNGIMWVSVDNATTHGYALGLQVQPNGTATLLYTVDLGVNEIPSGVTIGAVDRQVYVTDFTLAGHVFVIDPNTRALTTLTIPGVFGRASAIASEADGLGNQNVVVAEWGSGYLAKYNTGSATWTQTQVQNTGFDYCEGVTLGPDGTFWAGCDSHAVIQYNALNTTHALFPSGVNGNTTGGAPGSDNSIWFGEWGSGNVAKVQLP